MSKQTKRSALAEAVRGGTSGYSRRMANEAYKRRVAGVAEMFARAVNGDRYALADFHGIMGGTGARSRMYEALSTSDFPVLFGDYLSRSLATRYAQAAPEWRMFATRQVNPDFRPTKVIDFLGGGAKLDIVPELDEYPARGFDESEFETLLGKYGNRLQWSWEMQVNDDLSAFSRAPGALTRGATATEDYIAMSVVVDSAGFNSDLFDSVDNKPLTAANLEAAYQSISDVVDEDGNPIDIGDPVLLVPRALALTAQNILNTTEIRRTVSGTESLTVGNGLSVTPKLAVSRWFTAINKDANAKTSWALLPDPNGPRPAVIETFLRGHESPDLRVKADAGMTLGGQTIDPAEGSFERDDVQYRVRHVVGGNVGFTDAVYASEGA